MGMELSGPAVRVLGCLMEKEMATPEYYPLSLNALVNGCNQKSNRDPVVDYDEETVNAALAELKERQLVWQSGAGRVPKFGEGFSAGTNLIAREKAALCLLLLRGPQTVGELRGRSERLYAFSGLEEVEESLASLAEMGLAAKLPRQPGRKEHRYAHLLGGEPEPAAAEAGAEGLLAAVPGKGRLGVLEEEVAALREEVAALREELQAFRRQFE
ncbi:MAG: YceH family protein [Desulfobacteraceae bacterium]|nr:YceH family protein [Desulfobacteraceae bacterium]